MTKVPRFAERVLGKVAAMVGSEHELWLIVGSLVHKRVRSRTRFCY